MFRLPKMAGMAVLEMALCIMLFVTIVLATAALFFYLFNTQTIEHAVHSNAGKIKVAPFKVVTTNGSVDYELSGEELDSSINSAANELTQALAQELIGFDTDDLTVQVGYIEVTSQSPNYIIKSHQSVTRGDGNSAIALNNLSAPGIKNILNGLLTPDTQFPTAVVLRVRVNLKTDSFTRFDILKVTPPNIEVDVTLPLRQQTALLG